MLATIHVVLNSAVLLLGLFAIHACIRPEYPSQDTVFGRLCRAEPALYHVANVFPVIAGIYGTNALCIHFALFDAARLETVNDAIRVAFAVTLAVFVIALARAIGGARRQRDGAA